MMAKEQGKSTVLSVLRGILVVFFNLILYSLILFAIVWVCKNSYHFAYEVFGDVTVAEEPGTDVVVTIDKDQEALSVSKSLEVDGLVVNAYSFYLRVRLSMADGKVLKPGEYTLNTSMTYDEILDKILKSEAS